MNQLTLNRKQLALPGFQIKENGLVANKTITQAQWENAGDVLFAIESRLPWMIGDLINARQEKYGDLSEICEARGWNYGTAANCSSVCRAFQLSRRRESLSFGHHATAQGEIQEDLLDWAEDEQASIAELRSEKSKRQRADRIAAELPSGTFNLLYADPPWAYGDERTSDTAPTGGAAVHYDTMPLQDICAMELPCLADDSVLFLWATVPLMPDALAVCEAWGFVYKTHLVWDKVRPYFGNYSQVQHELLLVCTRGSFVPTGTLPHSVVTEEKSDHSSKPDRFYEIIETLYPSATCIELFARRARKGWDRWGNQA